ncbi:MAG: ferritin-like domain-containing protein [Sphingomonas phyllosphaerae]
MMDTITSDRRGALRAALSIGVASSLIAMTAQGAQAQSSGDIDALNFVLNVEYLNAQFLTYVTTGQGLATSSLAGATDPGTVKPGRKVTFSDTMLSSIVTEMAADNRAHFNPIKTVIGALAISQPALDLSADATGAFSVAMQRAGLVGSGAAFDPYASEENFLYAAFLLKGISVSAYRGLLATASNRVVAALLAGILATESYHHATIRSFLYSRGAKVARLRDNAAAIAAMCQKLAGGGLFTGVAPTSRKYEAANGPVTITVANITPTDGDGDVPGRTPQQLLRILYQSSGQATSGGFFPAGVNGSIRSSTAA